MSSSPLSGSEIRSAFLHYFESKQHRILPSAPLVPESDPTLLFTNAGMVPFKRIFLGEEVRDYRRATSSQKCMRVSGKHNDLENVGRTPRHHTFFEMLGNFSFGDYFKREAIVMGWELLTEVLKIDSDRLVATVFLEDDEAEELWRTEVGLPASRVYRLGESENFWSMGETGPCGPCSEIHIDFGVGTKSTCDNPNCDPSCECGRFLEAWNLVFMQFNRDGSGTLTPLPKPSIDTGAGLERLAAICQGVPTNYDTDLFRGILERIGQLSESRIGENAERDVSMRVIADHARALTFLIGDGILPSNEGRGYVLRRILRRAARHGVFLGLEKPFLFDVSGAVIDEMGAVYPELKERRRYIADRIEREEDRFLRTLSKGLAILEQEVEEVKARGADSLPGSVVFKLYDTYGFPVDLTADILRDQNLSIDSAGFDAEMRVQRERARKAWKGSGEERVSEIYGRLDAKLVTKRSDPDYRELGCRSEIVAILVEGEERASAFAGEEVELIVKQTPFYAESGGQVGDCGLIATRDGACVEVETTQRPIGELVVHRGRVVDGAFRAGAQAELRVDKSRRADTARNHSGTHVLHAALRQVLGPQAMQKGSLVSPSHLRFDFTHDSPLTPEQLEKIETLANRWIAEAAPGRIRHLPYKEAIEEGAMALFSEKYGDEVRVVSFGDFSTELCGGTHVANTGDIGTLKIVSETGVAAGVRRIEALTGRGALAYLHEQDQLLETIAGKLKTNRTALPARIDKLLEDKRELEVELKQLRKAAQGAASADLVTSASEINGVRVIAARVEAADRKALRPMVDELRNKLGSGIVLLACVEGGRVALALGVTPDLTKRFKAGALVAEVAKEVGGKGGGRPDFAQAGGQDASKLDAALAKFRSLVEVEGTP